MKTNKKLIIELAIVFVGFSIAIISLVIGIAALYSKYRVWSYDQHRKAQFALKDNQDRSKNK